MSPTVPLPHVIPITTAFSIVDFSGVFAAALGGAFAAKQNERFHYDYVGVMGLGLISALGGGISRDVLIGHGPPLSLVDVRYLLVALAGAGLGLSMTRLRRSVRTLLLYVDAAGLGFFAVAGSARAAGAGLSFLPALLLGVTTAVGGGSLRDVFSGRTPQIFERGEPYAIVAALSSVVFLVSETWLGAGAAATTLGVLSGFLFRLMALRFAWRTEKAR